jgi:hypothetical protein
MLALFTVATTLPRLLRAHASEAIPQPTPTPPSTRQGSTPAPQPATDQPPAATSNLPDEPSHPTPPRQPYQGLPSPQAGTTATQVIASQPTQISAGPSVAEIEQLQERLVQLDARAQTVDRAIAQLRRQQEADGLGLRNDMETADAKLNSYMQIARQDMQLSKTASAQLDMDKAEAELDTLEKFLGR